jgi:hypothetical protein
LVTRICIRVADALNRLFEALFQAVGYTILFLVVVLLLFSEDARAFAGDVSIQVGRLIVAGVIHAVCLQKELPEGSLRAFCEAIGAL